jgi:hypothetical protein
MTHPDATQPAEWPRTLAGLLELAVNWDGKSQPPPEETADAEDWNAAARNLVALAEDARAFITALGLNPNEPDLDTLAAAGAYIQANLGGGGGGFAIQRGDTTAAIGYVAPTPGAKAYSEATLNQIPGDTNRFDHRGLHPSIGDFLTNCEFRSVLASPFLFSAGELLIRIEGTIAATLANVVAGLNSLSLSPTYYIVTNPSGNILRTEIQANSGSGNDQPHIVDSGGSGNWIPSTSFYQGGANPQTETETPVTLQSFFLEVPSNGPTGLMNSEIKSGEQGTEVGFTVTGDEDIVDEANIAFVDIPVGVLTTRRGVFIPPAKVQKNGNAVVSWTWGGVSFFANISKFAG